MTFVTNPRDYQHYFQSSLVDFQAAVQPFTQAAGGTLVVYCITLLVYCITLLVYCITLLVYRMTILIYCIAAVQPFTQAAGGTLLVVYCIP